MAPENTEKDAIIDKENKKRFFSVICVMASDDKNSWQSLNENSFIPLLN